MRYATLLALALCPMLLLGCDTDKSQPATPSKTTTTQAEDSQPSPTVETVKKEAEKQVEQVKEDVQQQAEAIKEEVREQIVEAEKSVDKAVDDAESSAHKLAAGSIPQVPGVAAPATVAAATGSAEPPGLVTYEASQGTVSFDHGAHMVRAECSACHPTDPPETVAVDKTWAHKTCKGCHKQRGMGPKSCKGCHKK